VTDKIVGMLDKGIVPWQKPWRSVNDIAVSHMTGKPYSLLNQWLCDNRGGEYVTFNQAKKLGGNVKRGAKGYYIVFWSPVEKTRINANGEEEKDVYFALKNYTVFNIEDCDGIEPKFLKADVLNEEVNPIDEAERIATAYVEREGITLESSKSNRAYYVPALDSVQVPLLQQYETAADYYATLYHELTHSTGHQSRLNRDTIAQIAAFGSDTYSREELVAEMGSAFAIARLGLSNDHTEERSAAYIKGWREYIAKDTQAVIFAAKQAEKAVNYIFGETL
jgi:antirestriction protein ArdC